MRKKLILLLILPLLLCGALLWAHDARWARLDMEFREAILHQTASGAKPGMVITVSKTNAACDLAVWTPAQVEAALADVHLQASRRQNPDWSGLTLHFSDYRSDSRDSLIFYVSLEGQQSGISNLDTSGDSGLDAWNGLQLTPASLRALKKRVMAQYGAQIEAFKAPDWGQPNRGKKP